MITPADELRTAADKLRALATADGVSPAPWHTEWDMQQYELRGAAATRYPITEWSYAIVTTGPKVSEQRAECDTANADYITAMHPGVGAALANWLDAEATGPMAGLHNDRCMERGCTISAALAVARLINGSQP